VAGLSPDRLGSLQRSPRPQTPRARSSALPTAPRLMPLETERSGSSYFPISNTVSERCQFGTETNSDDLLPTTASHSQHNTLSSVDQQRYMTACWQQSTECVAIIHFTHKYIV